jgi:hypothetical protein
MPQRAERIEPRSTPSATKWQQGAPRATRNRDACAAAPYPQREKEPYMAKASYLPYHFVDHLRKPGLKFSGGVVALNQYMCKTKSNGGNDSASSLLGKLRKMKDGEDGSTLETLVGQNEFEVALKGQGRPETFVAIWDFMCRNKEKLKKTKVEVCGRRVKKDGVYEKNVLRTGNVHDLYFDGRSDQEAIQAMVLDRFFGLDCIGFTAGVLIYNGEWSEYKGGVPLQWAKWFCTEKVNSAKDVKPLDFMIWSGHIAMVDWVWKVSEHGKSVDVDVAQCSSGEETGPQYNTHALLTETGKVEDGHRKFKFSDRGRPEAPVSGEFFIMRRKDFYWEKQN